MSEDKINYFIERTDKRLESIEEKLEVILRFKWQVIGGSIVLSALVSVAIKILFP